MSLSLVLCALLQAQDAPKPVEAPAPKADESPVEVYLKDGLRFRSKDGDFEARIGGRLLVHSRTVFDRPDDVNAAPFRTVPDTFFVRQARLEMEGSLYRDWGFKVQVDFGTGQYNQNPATGGLAAANVTGTLRDGFVEWRRHKEFQVRLGQFFEQVSQEDITSTRFIDFVERSPLNRLMPGREIGLQLSGSLFEDVFSYAVMAVNGGALINDQGRAVVDREDEKEAAVLLRLWPFRHSGSDLLKGLRIGLGASVGSVDSIAASGFDLVTTELSVLWFDANPAAGTFDGRRTRIDPQLQWAAGPFSLSAEYLIREDELDASFAESELETSGWYVAAGVVLTGEDKKPEARIVPKGEWGAVELVVRAARVTVENGIDSGVLLAGTGSAEEVTTFTAGFNWWITRNVRVSTDVVFEKFDEELQFDTRAEDSLVGLLVRGQIDF